MGRKSHLPLLGRGVPSVGGAISKRRRNDFPVLPPSLPGGGIQFLATDAALVGLEAMVLDRFRAARRSRRALRRSGAGLAGRIARGAGVEALRRAGLAVGI